MNETIMSMMFVTENVSYSSASILSSADTSALVPNSAADIYKWIVYTLIAPAIDIFGIVTNIINIMCFVKQGFKDPINVNLLGLAIADLGSLVTILWTNVCLNPAMNAADLPFDPIEVQYLTSGMPHATFTRISGWITALITLERCLCISMPLKVNSIITSKRVSIVITCFFITLTASGAPVYFVNKMDMKFVPERNKTIFGLVFTEDRESVENVSYLINNVTLPFCSFVIIFVCTVILVVKLQAKIKWRNTSTTTEQADIVSNRNQKVAKMVVMISTLFIACFIPLCILFIVIAFMPEFFINGKYINVLLVVGGTGILMESINSSVNIFIYYKMSSKYRAVLKEQFCKGKHLSK